MGRWPRRAAVRLVRGANYVELGEDEVILQAGEGHGFYNADNNYNLYSKMLAFFDRYIGDRRERVDVETVEKAPEPAQQ